MHIKTSKHNREYFNHIVTDQLSIHNSCTKPLQFISLNSNLRYVINICLTVIMLLYFTSELKSQYNSIEKLDRINNDSIVNILKVIQLEKYNIKKGHHSPKNRRIILHSSREFSAICMFDKSCLYSFADNNTN